ncbi:hypothetical protein MKQ68_08220 [Chitinophaga horti]|uniref:Tryptophan-rich sensory protein n=1 Tax=Chitinophaga horti TaxID=2920382 RepID=A0ABY6JA79_9BACT|nr:hypothetical protein [Chitinophaga horti]UYQ95079.1 hypothetical protein MKQ68_08220 [Chitinophaga horti]
MSISINLARYRQQAVFNLIGLILMITVNALANILPINGKDTGTLSDQYPNYFTPAGLTFSIWSVIYLGLILCVIYQLWLAFSRGHIEELHNFMTRMRGWFLLNCVGNAGWIFAWHYEQVALSLGIMVFILITLLVIQHRFRMFYPGAGGRERALVHIPFSLYLGWIAVAIIANTTALLVHINWTPAMSPGWAVIMVIVATGFTLLAVFVRNNIPYALVSLWAITGINLKRSAAGGLENQNIILAATVCMVIIVLAVIIQLFRSRKSMISARV